MYRDHTRPTQCVLVRWGVGAAWIGGAAALEAVRRGEVR